MTELRFSADKINSQTISGSLTTTSAKEGKQKIYRLAERNRLTVRNVQVKSAYLYKVN